MGATPVQSNRRAQWSWALYDWANSAFATTVMAGFFPVFYSGITQGISAEDSQFYFNLALAAASILIAVSAPILGAVADRGPPKLWHAYSK